MSGEGEFEDVFQRMADRGRDRGGPRPIPPNVWMTYNEATKAARLRSPESVRARMKAHPEAYERRPAKGCPVEGCVLIRRVA